MKKANPVSMMGVVIYISSDRGRAIIWCEDHGPLAYVRANKALQNPNSISVGDCVTFSARTDGDFRVARDLRPMSLPPVMGLAETLKHRVPGPCKADNDENVIYPQFTAQRRFG